MDYLLSKPDKKLVGEIVLPSSKSVSNRVLIIRAMCDHDFKIENLSESEDTKILNSILNSGSNIFDIGNAGTVMRFFTTLASKTVGQWIITGSERMKQRPMGDLVDALRNLGAIIEYTEKEGFPPLKITGTKLKGKEIAVKGSVSSQFISALLMIAPDMIDGLTINIEGKIVSQPYIEMTLKLMEFFGVKTVWKGNTITIKEQLYKGQNITIETDWSAASYWYEIAAFCDEVDLNLTGLKKNSIQGDKIMAEIFDQLGVKTSTIKNGIKLTRKEVTAKSIDMDCTDFPDLVQPLAVSCSMLNIPYHLKGLETLKIKETDRISALKKELGKFGILLKTSDSEILWDGSVKKTKQKLEIETYSDHRMAMAFAPVAIVHPELRIKDIAVVKKSYPFFWDDLKKVNFKMDIS